MCWAVCGFFPSCSLPAGPAAWETRGCGRWGAGRKSRGGAGSRGRAPMVLGAGAGLAACFGCGGSQASRGCRICSEDLQGEGCKNALVLCRFCGFGGSSKLQALPVSVAHVERGLGAALAARGPRGVAGVGCVRPSWVCRGNGLSAPLATCRQLKSPSGSWGGAAPCPRPCSLPAPRGRGAGCCETPRAERHPVNH